MKEVPLRDVATVTSGFAFKSSLFNQDGDGMPLIRCRDVNTGNANTFYSGEYDEQFVVHHGDLLVSMDGDFRVKKWDGAESLLNQRVCRIEPIETRADLNYLMHFLPDRLQRIQDATSFATVKHLSAKKLLAVDVPLPSLDKQKRIAAILDKADAIRHKRQQTLTLTEDLLRSAFLDLVGPSGDGYDGWARVPVEELVESRKGSIRSGPFGSALRHAEFVDSGIAVLGIDNAVKNRFEWSERRFITDEKYEELKRYTVFAGDVLITIMGTTGRSSVVPDDIPSAITTKHLATLTLRRDIAEPEFLSHAIHMHPSVLKQIGSANRGAIMAGLNLGLIRKLEIPVPPIHAQRDFVRALTRIRTLQAKLERSLPDDLFGSLSQRAFAGQL